MLPAARADAQGVVYGIGGFGGYTGWFGGAGTYHIAGGGELLVKGIAGAGAEIGLLGVDFRANRRAGVRLEFRDHLRRDSRGSVHYYSIRAGIAVR